MTRVHRCLVASVVLAALPLALAAQEGRPLAPDEKLFIHAVALKVRHPSKEVGDKELVVKAGKSAREEKPEWASDRDDPVLVALASIESNRELRTKYRESLKRLLGDNPRENADKLIREIQRDYGEEKVKMYRTVLRKTEGKGLNRGDLPWPLCIPFGCCR